MEKSGRMKRLRGVASNFDHRTDATVYFSYETFEYGIEASRFDVKYPDINGQRHLMLTIDLN